MMSTSVCIYVYIYILYMLLIYLWYVCWKHDDVYSADDGHGLILRAIYIDADEYNDDDHIISYDMTWYNII